VFKKSYEQTQHERSPANTSLPGRQAGVLSPSHGPMRDKGATAKEAEMRWPPQGDDPALREI